MKKILDYLLKNKFNLTVNNQYNIRYKDDIYRVCVSDEYFYIFIICESDLKYPSLIYSKWPVHDIFNVYEYDSIYNELNKMFIFKDRKNVINGLYSL